MPDLRNIPVRFVGTRARRELMSGKVFMFSRVYGVHQRLGGGGGGGGLLRDNRRI